MKCEKCTVEHDGIYGSGRFCSAKCARSFSTANDRDKISKKVSLRMKGRPPTGKPYAKGDGRVRGKGRWDYIKEVNLKASQYATPSICRNCGTPWHRTYGSKGYYCSQKCQHDFAWKQRKGLIESGKLVTSDNIKRYLKEKNYACSECGISDWQNKPISLHIHHVDGNPDNNVLSNCTLICPNCHSQTHNWCAKNHSKNQSNRSKYFKDWYEKQKLVGS